MEMRGGLRKTKSLDGRENYTSIPIDISHKEDPTNSLATSCRKQMEELPDILPECCIYRAPHCLRKKLNEKFYIPRVVSIGPFHYNKKELQGMEEHKLRCMKAFLRRTETSLENFITAINGLEKRARNFYAEKINLSVAKFVKILMIDSFFILETMMSPQVRNRFYLPSQVFFFEADLVLIENQVPFFVLNELFQLAFPNSHRAKFLELSINYLAVFFLFNDKFKSIRKVDKHLNLGLEILHLVDLLRICHLPSTLRSSSAASIPESISIPNVTELQEAGIQLLKLGSPSTLRSPSAASTPKSISIPNATELQEARIQLSKLGSPSTLRSPSAASTPESISIPNATELQEAGIQFSKLGSSDHCLLDIKYTKNELKIPVLHVQEFSDIVLRNILIFENCHYLYDTYIRDYVYFMQMLIDTTKDADLLIQNGIIVDWIGESSTVAALFSNVGRDLWIVYSSYYFNDISKELNTYCSDSRHKWKAIFKRDYCSTPWMIASTTAAIILLILTFLSTIVAFLAL